MPNGHGGKRTGSGRKPKDLYTKISEGNKGGRALKKVEFTEKHDFCKTPPAYLHGMKREKLENIVPTPMDIYHEVIEYLEPTECLNLIPKMLISDYVMAKYYLICSQQELKFVPTVVCMKKRDPKRNEPNDFYEISNFANAMIKLQKNVLACWNPIWDIVSRNCQKLIENPEEDLFLTLFGARKRKSQKVGVSDE